MFTVVTLHLIHKIVLIWEKGLMQPFSLILKKAIKMCGIYSQGSGLYLRKMVNAYSKGRRNTELCVMSLQVRMKITSKSSKSQQGVALLLSPFPPNVFASWKTSFF